VRRALKILADREVSPQTGLLKSTLLQLDSTFSERNYGASSFLDFVEKLAQGGLVTLKHAGRSVMVELAPGADGDGELTEPAATPAVAVSERPAEGRPEERPLDGQQPREPVQAVESQEAGVGRAAGILSAAVHARWPMYLRNVKQILRAAEGGFDERRYGFGGLMDLLKACQRAGIVRIERDRRGGLRVFQGPQMQSAPVHAPQRDVEAIDVVEVMPIEAGSIEPIAAAAEPEPEMVEAEPIPIDTTAELLGVAKPKRTRARLPRAATSTTPARKTARKTAGRRPARSRKTAPDND
jgi:hypothetical protein